MAAAKKSHWLRNTIIVLLICTVAGTALAAAQFTREPERTSANATLQFSFEGAARGVGPNGDRFNVDGLKSDEVLNAALEASGLTGTYTAEQLRENLMVTGVYPNDFVDQVMSYESLLSFTANRELTVNEFHPSVYNVVLYSDFDTTISRQTLEGLLSNILESYRSYFARTTARGMDWQDKKIYQLDQYDYPQQLEVIQEVMTQQARYAQEMYEKEPTFQRGGKGFNDIYVRFNSLVESDIVRMNARITINALTRNTARLLTQYQFEIRGLNNELEKKTEQLQRLDELIESYDKNEIIYLSTAESLTKIDGNSSVTYDVLVRSRKSVSDEITEINSRITSYQLKLADLMNSSEKRGGMSDAAIDTQGKTPDEEMDETDETEMMEVDEIQALTEEEIEAAAKEAEEAVMQQVATLEKEIATLVEKREAITSDFASLLEEYMLQQVNEQTVRTFDYQYSAPEFLSAAFAKKVIKTAGPICALGFMLCMVLLIISRKKEEI